MIRFKIYFYIDYYKAQNQFDELTRISIFSMTSVAIFAIVFQAYSKNKVIQRDTIKRTNETLLQI